MQVNRNFLWSEVFAGELENLGVENVCISPGSRSTPLAAAFARNESFNKYTILDERSAGFFALGLAKATGKPVVIISTSGTAAAELHPAIIEAYQSRTPLIVCTADRPPEVHNSGANQTINQQFLYRNHVRWFADMGMPEPGLSHLKTLRKRTREAFSTALFKDKGPVHLNFPFKKPLEPSNAQEVVGDMLKEDSRLAEYTPPVKEFISRESDEKTLQMMLRVIKRIDHGLIVVGPGNFSSSFKSALVKLSEITQYPIFADAGSGLRFGSSDKNIITNYDAFLRSEKFASENPAKVVLQFGRTPTSLVLGDYMKKYGPLRYIINEYGDFFDPSRKSVASMPYKPEMFVDYMNNSLSSFKRGNDGIAWLKIFLGIEKDTEKIKQEVVGSAKFPFEGRVMNEVLDNLNSDTNLFVSNSMPIRDYDWMASQYSSKVDTFTNRGASGIDGIISTSLGLSASTGKRTCVITGDIAFFYDSGALLTADKYKLPLTVVLINNNGGGIFDSLPVSKDKDIFDEYFKMPHSITFSHYARLFSGNHIKVSEWSELSSALKEAQKSDKWSLIEVETDSAESRKVREEYWRKVVKTFDK